MEEDVILYISIKKTLKIIAIKRGTIIGIIPFRKDPDSFFLDSFMAKLNLQ
jgi:hypothetical protein